MNRKHVEALAAALADVRPTLFFGISQSEAEWERWSDCVDRVGDVCVEFVPDIGKAEFCNSAGLFIPEKA